MGLDYSIRTYVKKDNISKCLKWFYKNTHQFDKKPFSVLINNELFEINGDGVKLNDYQSNYIDKNEEIQEFEKIYFNTSLIFDIEPKIIASIPGWELDYDINLIKDFKEDFESLYLGNGKIRIGGFDSTITKLKNSEIYEIELTAVTSDISIMLETSISVKKWILEFSRISDSILTYLDLEHNGHKIMYYKGKEIEITIREGFEEGEENKLSSLLDDYFDLTYDED